MGKHMSAAQDLGPPAPQSSSPNGPELRGHPASLCSSREGPHGPESHARQAPIHTQVDCAWRPAGASGPEAEAAEGVTCHEKLAQAAPDAWFQPHLRGPRGPLEAGGLPACYCPLV